MFLEYQMSILEGFPMVHVTLKTGVMILKIKLKYIYSLMYVLSLSVLYFVCIRTLIVCIIHFLMGFPL